MKSLSRAQFFATPWTVAYQVPLSVGFCRQEYWSGLPFPFLGDLPDSGIEPRSPALEADTLTSKPPGKPGVRGVCNFLGSVLPQQKFEVADGPVLQLSFIGKQRKIHPQSMRVGRPKRHEEKPLVQFWLLFLCFFLLSLSLLYVNCTSQEGCLFYLRSSLWSSDLPLFYFHRLFPCLLATAILDSFFLF